MKTLLELTQNILSSLDSDEVSSIYDTVESLQVATIILDTLDAEFSNLEFPSFGRIVQLQSVSDVDRPNYLRYGSDVSQIDTVRYRDNRAADRYREVRYLTPADFFGRINLITTTGANQREIVDPSGIKYVISTNAAPTFYTSVDNDYLIFNSYDVNFETTMEAENSFALASSSLAEGELIDNYTPPIPATMVPLLREASRATAFLTLKQIPNVKSEQLVRRLRSRMQNTLYKSKKADWPYARSKYDFSRKR